MKAASIVRKLDAILNKAGATDRPVYKRVYTHTGGSELLGRVTTTTYTDSLCSPQPALARLDEESGLVLSSSLAKPVDAMLGVFSPSAVSLGDLQNSLLVFVLIAEDKSEETFRVADYETIAVGGSSAAFIVTLRSVSR